LREGALENHLTHKYGGEGNRIQGTRREKGSAITKTQTLTGVPSGSAKVF